MVHSDHGSQYTSWAFGQRLRAAGLLGSMGSVGDCFENALAESSFSSLQVELLDRQTWATRSQLANAIFEWIEAWYDPRRRHSALGYRRRPSVALSVSSCRQCPRRSKTSGGRMNSSTGGPPTSAQVFGGVDFEQFVRVATAGRASAYGYQLRLAAEGLPDVLTVPTGSGKTLAAVLPWLYRRMAHPQTEVRAATPRWLVVVLPQRTLVEQTHGVTSEWLHNLGLDVPVHLLMGGEGRDDRDWKAHPERERIFVGTQDMVLSRLLMRGFAEGRVAWPRSFGLLHANVQFVFDEVQLMGPGLPTSLQLEGLREVLGTAQPCRSMWMSATLDLAELSTVDFRRELSVVGLDDADRSGLLRHRLEATRTVRRANLADANPRRYARSLAEAVLAEHRVGTRTLVVVNTVERAVEVVEALTEVDPAATTVLLHSHYRPGDRRTQTERALAPPGPRGTIVVATQVLEAGVDLTSDTLVTEAAPWSSVVQRAGRCNRDGQAVDARLVWVRPPAPLPYDAAEIEHSAMALEDLEATAVTGSGLGAATTELLRPVHRVLRRRDLVELFDTAPDLSGNDIDVSPFIRDATDRNVSVAWRRADGTSPDAAPEREELCPAPLKAVRELVGDQEARVQDQIEGGWRRAQLDDVRPGAVIVLDAARGGYLPERGFAPRSTTPVEPVLLTVVPPDAVATDPHSTGSRWVPLAEHLADVEREAATLLDALGPAPGLSAEVRQAVLLAGRYHDLGKAHPTFRRALEKANPEHPPPVDGAWAKSPGHAPLRTEPRYFRHELVSALLLADDALGLVDGVAEADLVVFLALAHHGKVRVTLRGQPDEPEGTVLGVVDGDRTLELSLPAGTLLPARTLSLAATRLGEGSLTSRALRLRDRPDLGPFRLAFCEAVVRGADWRASARYETTSEGVR